MGKTLSEQIDALATKTLRRRDTCPACGEALHRDPRKIDDHVGNCLDLRDAMIDRIDRGAR